MGLFGPEDFQFDPSREVDDLMREGRRDALEDALSRVDELDDCWSVFRQFITEAIVDDVVIRRVIIDTRKDVAKAIVESEYDRLLDMSAHKLISQERTAVMVKAAEMLLHDPSTVSEIKNLAVALLREQLREEISKDVREQLKSDPVFIEDVKRELKRQIMSI